MTLCLNCGYGLIVSSSEPDHLVCTECGKSYSISDRFVADVVGVDAGGKPLSLRRRAMVWLRACISMRGLLRVNEYERLTKRRWNPALLVIAALLSFGVAGMVRAALAVAICLSDGTPGAAAFAHSAIVPELFRPCDSFMTTPVVPFRANLRVLDWGVIAVFTALCATPGIAVLLRRGMGPGGVLRAVLCCGMLTPWVMAAPAMLVYAVVVLANIVRYIGALDPNTFGVRLDSCEGAWRYMTVGLLLGFQAWWWLSCIPYLDKRPQLLALCILTAGVAGTAAMWFVSS